MEDLYYHTCGYPIIFETRPDDRSASAVFRDGGQPGAGDSEATEVCPNCGEVLLLGDLAPEPIDEWW